MQGVMMSCFQKCKTNLSNMKKLARTTTYHSIRNSKSRMGRPPGRAGRSVDLLQIFDRWLIGFRKHAPIEADSNKGGARPVGREIKNKY